MNTMDTIPTRELSIAELLNRRTEFEHLITDRKPFRLPNHESDIESLRFFINNGHKSNRFRKNYKRARELAAEILKHYDESMESNCIRLEG